MMTQLTTFRQEKFPLTQGFCSSQAFSWLEAAQPAQQEQSAFLSLLFPVLISSRKSLTHTAPRATFDRMSGHPPGLTQVDTKFNTPGVENISLPFYLFIKLLCWQVKGFFVCLFFRWDIIETNPNFSTSMPAWELYRNKLQHFTCMERAENWENHNHLIWIVIHR